MTALKSTFLKFALSFFAILGLTACVSVGPETMPVETGQADHYDLYLLIGQSNMAGRGRVEGVDTTPHVCVDMLNKSNDWVPAVEPIHFDKPERIGTGPGLAFGKAIADQDTARRIGLIPSAVGGSVIASWTPGGFHKQTGVYPYDEAVARARAAMKDGKLKAILWHQGEYDSKPAEVLLYRDALVSLAFNLRRDLEAQNVPFLVGGLGDFLEPKRPDSVKINAILSDVSNFISNSYFISAEGLIDKGDKLHFNSLSYRILGQRFARALRKSRSASVLSTDDARSQQCPA